MKNRKLNLERLETRLMLAGDALASGWHHLGAPSDVNADGAISPLDALLVVNALEDHPGQLLQAPAENRSFIDVNHDGMLSPLDALLVVNDLMPPRAAASSTILPLATFNGAELLGPQNLLTKSDVETLLKRASQASPSDDAIIAVVDRSGRIVGVRVEDGVAASIQGDPDRLAFAIDGAVAKARTAAFFSSNAAPLPSRTIRFISQTTNTQREVESAPTHDKPEFRGPGFVAPIGVGGHFPPEIPFTPQVDLFAIEHQSRDSEVHPGADGIKSPTGPGAGNDDFRLTTRFNADPDHIATNAELFFDTWPESYGFVTGTAPDAQSRGIATLPGGIPLYKDVTDPAGQPVPGLPPVNLVGGIGVFFPGPNGFSTFEQGFEHASDRGGIPQTEAERTNAPRVLEAEFMAFIAAAGDGLVGPRSLQRNLAEFNSLLEPLPDFPLPIGRIDLVGITLEIYGPTPSRQSPIPGIDRLIQVGRNLGITGVASGLNVKVTPVETVLDGQAVPEGWLVKPHAATDGSLSAADVERIIRQGVEEADETRAAIRLDIANGFTPGPRTRMVLAVADKQGDLLGLFRMPDATIFSIDVSIAKARNTAYYADAADIQTPDIVDFDGDGVLGPVVQSLGNRQGDTVPKGTALTNRTFRFLVEPRYPTGIDLDNATNRRIVASLDNDATRDLCEQSVDLCKRIAPQSMLRMPGINPLTAENLVNTAPLPSSVYADASSLSVLAFDAFHVSRNFRDPGDADVVIFGSDDGAGNEIEQPLANQNGVVFFPGSAPLYIAGNLQGGFGVSGDGVDQDDVVTSSGFVGFDVPDDLRVDQFIVGGVRLPYIKFNRNPRGA